MNSIFAKNYKVGQEFKLKQNEIITTISLGGVKYFKTKSGDVLNSIDSKLLESPLIELITSDSEDWEVLRMIGDKDFEKSRYRVLNKNWIELLEVLGYEVFQREVSEDDMNNCNY